MGANGVRIMWLALCFVLCRTHRKLTQDFLSWRDGLYNERGEQGSSVAKSGVGGVMSKTPQQRTAEKDSEGCVGCGWVWGGLSIPQGINRAAYRGLPTVGV